MTDSSNTRAAKSKKPTHTAHHVKEVPGGESIWTRIGSAWAHQDGQGFNIQIDAVPLDGRILLRVASPRTN